MDTNGARRQKPTHGVADVPAGFLLGRPPLATSRTSTYAT
jgi:hypothetical protein